MSKCVCCVYWFFFFKQKTAYEMRISDWSSDVCSSDLRWIESVDILVAETAGVDGREGYYANYGALRDMVQNLMLQLLALIAMEIGRASCRARVCQSV